MASQHSLSVESVADFAVIASIVRGTGRAHRGKSGRCCPLRKRREGPTGRKAALYLKTMGPQRTDLAEDFIARFASVPLVTECVFLRPRYLRGHVEREVADLLVVHREQALIISLKHQAEPGSRSPAKAERWVRQHAEQAATQAMGAIRTLKKRRLWCEHYRRGRVDFDASELEPVQAVVAVEHTGGLVRLADTAPLMHQGVPFSYFSANDLLNLIFELRSFPELQLYLAARASLSDETRLALGGEKHLYQQYLCNEGGFAGWIGFEKAAPEGTERASEVARIIGEKHRSDRMARFVEEVADLLSSRLPNYSKDLPPEVSAHFDPLSARKNYLMLQEELCDLTLLERRALGQLREDLLSKIEQDASPSALLHRAYIDHLRDRLYVVAVSRGYDRKASIEAGQHILLGGLAFYQKDRGIIIVERLGENFEIALIGGFAQHAEYRTLGEVLFANVPVSEFVGSLATGPRRVSSGA
ncbi:MAG: hypothetical protein ACLQAT_17310 [Candidatus Binataceae bacterium]